MGWEEVADTDRAHRSVAVQLLKRPPRSRVDRLAGNRLFMRRGPVNHVEVEVRGAEKRRAFPEGLQRFLVPPVRVPDFVDQKKVTPGNTGIPHGDAYGTLVPIDRRGVDQTIAGMNSAAKRIEERVALRDLPRTNSEAGHSDAVR